MSAVSNNWELPGMEWQEELEKWDVGNKKEEEERKAQGKKTDLPGISLLSPVRVTEWEGEGKEETYRASMRTEKHGDPFHKRCDSSICWMFSFKVQCSRRTRGIELIIHSVWMSTGSMFAIIQSLESGTNAFSITRDSTSKISINLRETGLESGDPGWRLHHLSLRLG